VGDDRDVDVIEVQLAPTPPDIPADAGLGDVGALLVDEALPDPARRVALLRWRLLVLGQPLADGGGVGADRRLGPGLDGLTTAAGRPMPAPAGPHAGAPDGGAPARGSTPLEIYFSVLERKVLTPPDAVSLEELAARILAFQARYEILTRPFEWKFTRADLHALLERLAERSPVLPEAA
jgi:hypothetical protein